VTWNAVDNVRTSTATESHQDIRPRSASSHAARSKALPEILVPNPQVQAKVARYATAKRDITDKHLSGLNDINDSA